MYKFKEIVFILLFLPLNIPYSLWGFHHFQQRGGIGQFLIPFMFLSKWDQIQWFVYKELMPKRTFFWCNALFLVFNTQIEDEDFPYDTYVFGGQKTFAVLFLLFYNHSNTETPIQAETGFYFLLALLSRYSIAQDIGLLIILIIILQYGRGQIRMGSHQYSQEEFRFAIEPAKYPPARLGYPFRRAIAYILGKWQKSTDIRNGLEGIVHTPVRRKRSLKRYIREDDEDATRDTNGEREETALVESRGPQEQISRSDSTRSFEIQRCGLIRDEDA